MLVSLFSILICIICIALFFLLYMLKIGVGFCSLLWSAVNSNVSLVRFVFRTLTLTLVWYVNFAMKPLLYHGDHFVETTSNCSNFSESFFTEEIQNGSVTTFFYDVSSFITVTFQYFEHPWAVKILLLILLGNIVSVLSKVGKQFKNIIQRSAPRLNNYEWQGVWDKMGKYLGQWAPPVFWNFTPEQVQNPEKLVEYLDKVCCHPGNSREMQIIATCWGLAHAYRALFNTIQCPQREEKVSGSDSKTTCNAATQTWATGPVAEPKNQPVPVSVAPVHKKKFWKRKSARLVREEEASSKREPEEELYEYPGEGPS